MLCMDTLPSSEFRRRYATLTTRTVVTVNGHTIGVWLPVKVAEEGRSEPKTPGQRPPFTPVPKRR